MGLSDIVDVSVSATAPAVSQAGFGTPLILSCHTKYSDLVRYYSDLAGIVADGFATTDPEYLAAAAIFAQDPSPPQVAIGKRALLPTMHATLTPTPQDSTAYKVTIAGVDYVFTSGTGATAAAIVTGLTNLINADSNCPVTASGTSTLILTAKTAGKFFALAVGSTDLLAIAIDHADPGVATDLAAIALFSNTWYAIVSIFQSAAEIAAIAAWAEANTKLYIASSSDTGIIGSGTTDVASTLKTAAYKKTGILYHPQNGQFAAAAWAGRCLPLTPGSETWKFKTLTGIDPVALTTTQLNNIKGKNCNYYVTIAGVNMTGDGVVADGEFLDVKRFIDWLVARIQEKVYALLVGSNKVPYTDSGATLVENRVRAVLKEAVRNGGLRENPAPTTTVPKVADVDITDRQNRTLPGVTFTGELAGAIHKTTIKGVVTA